MGDASEHSLLSASAAPRWTRCYGSVALESTQPNEGSSYAAEGTAAHALGSWLLGGSPKELADTMMARENCEASHWIGETITADGRDFVVDHEFASAVQDYVDYCRSLGGVALVETKVNYANWLGVPEELAWGTSDYIVIHDDGSMVAIDEDGYLCAAGLPGTREGRLIMSDVDYKHGAGVAVYPRWNEQAMLYAGGALNEIGLVLEPRDTDIIRLVIHQPRIGEGEPQEWYCTVAELKHWLRGEAATAAAHAVKLYEEQRQLVIDAAIVDHEPPALIQTELVPGEKQCKFCNAKAICPALANVVVDTVAMGFTDLTAVTVEDVKAQAASLTPLDLSQRLALAPMIEAALKAWRAAGEALLVADPASVPGWKLVRGKKGDRKWINPEKATATLVRYLGTKNALKPREPISPTQAEKLVTPKQYDQLKKAHITQAEGGVSMAPADDPREALDLRPKESSFTPIAEEDDADLSYLV